MPMGSDPPPLLPPPPAALPPPPPRRSVSSSAPALRGGGTGAAAAGSPRPRKSAAAAGCTKWRSGAGKVRAGWGRRSGVEKRGLPARKTHLCIGGGAPVPRISTLSTTRPRPASGGRRSLILLRRPVLGGRLVLLQPPLKRRLPVLREGRHGLQDGLHGDAVAWQRTVLASALLHLGLNALRALVKHGRDGCLQVWVQVDHLEGRGGGEVVELGFSAHTQDRQPPRTFT